MEIRCQPSLMSDSAYSDLAVQQETVLFVISMQSYGSTVANFATIYANHGKTSVILAPESANTWDCFQNLNRSIKILAFESFFREEFYQRYLDDRQSAKQKWRKLAQRIRNSGPDLLQNILTISPHQLQYVTTEVFPQLIAYQKLADAVLSAMNTNTLFVTRLKRITENVFANVASQKGIPVILANHGHIGKDSNPLELGPVEKHCDAILAWNEVQKQTWLTLFPQLSQKNIHVVGGIQWDEPIRRFSRQEPDQVSHRQSLSHILKLPNRADESNCFWITITIDDFVKQKLLKVLNSLNGLRGLQILIKTRPHETLEEYKPYVSKQFSFPVCIISSEVSVDLFKLLFASDLVMTGISTTNLDTLAVGTPVLTLAMKGTVLKDSRRPKLENDGLPIASSPRELRHLVEKWMSEKSCQREWKQAANRAAKNWIANYPQGDAGHKVFNLLQTLR